MADDLKPWDLFQLIRNTDYNESGLKVNWKVLTDTDRGIVRLLFQASNGTIDWIINFAFFSKKVTQIYKNQEKDFYVCVGWDTAWKSCNDEVMEAYIKVCNTYKDYKHEIDGWSLGGAMTQIAGEDYFYRTGEKPYGVTFGSPNPEKNGHVLKNSFQQLNMFANINDCVSYLPPFSGFDNSLDRINLGDSTINKAKLLMPWIYHTAYGNKKLYKNTKFY